METEEIVAARLRGATMQQLKEQSGWSYRDLRRLLCSRQAWPEGATSAQRQRLERQLLDDAEELLTLLWEPSTVYSFGGKDNTYNEVTHDEPTHKDRKDIGDTVTKLLSAARSLAEQEGSTNSGVMNLLVGLAREVGLRDGE